MENIHSHFSTLTASIQTTKNTHACVSIHGHMSSNCCVPKGTSSVLVCWNSNRVQCQRLSCQILLKFQTQVGVWHLTLCTHKSSVRQMGGIHTNLAEIPIQGTECTAVYMHWQTDAHKDRHTPTKITHIILINLQNLLEFTANASSMIWLHLTSVYRQCLCTSILEMVEAEVDIFFESILVIIYVRMCSFFNVCVLQYALPGAVGENWTGWFLWGLPLSLSRIHAHGRGCFTLTFILQGYTACQSIWCTLHMDIISKEAYSKTSSWIL